MSSRTSAASRAALAGALGLVLPVVLAAAALSGIAAAFGFSGPPAAPPVAAPGTPAGVPSLPAPAIPRQVLALDEAAAATCPGLSWSVLAAIGAIESGNGTSTLRGVRSGANFAGAEGPMQFEPATFAEYAEPAPPGGTVPPSPYDLTDAVFAAARLLCANGAAGGADLPGALFAYNHSETYVEDVLALAASYTRHRGAP